MKYLHKLIDFVRVFTKEEVTPFAKKNQILLTFVASIGVAIWAYRILQYYIARTNSAQIFNFLLIYIIFFVVLYVSFFKRWKEKINEHTVFISALGVAIPVLLFFLQLTINSSEQFIKQEGLLKEQFVKYEVLLKEENNRNSDHLKSIITDLSRDPYTIFWRDFSVDNYIQHWDHIQFTKSQDCRNLYATLTVNLNSLNNTNKMRQQLILIPNNLYKDMLKGAYETKPVLDEIIGKCQSL